MWEIRETRDYPRYRKSGMRGYKEDYTDEAYECGYEDGYRDAMKEAKSYYGERRGMRRHDEEK